MASTRKSRPRKSRPEAKAAATRAPKKRARKARTRNMSPASHTVSPKAALRRKPASPPPDRLDDFIAAAARVLALPIEPQWLGAIKTNLEVNLRLAVLVAEFALPDETEPAPVFVA